MSTMHLPTHHSITTSEQTIKAGVRGGYCSHRDSFLLYICEDCTNIEDVPSLTRRSEQEQDRWAKMAASCEHLEHAVAISGQEPDLNLTDCS